MEMVHGTDLPDPLSRPRIPKLWYHLPHPVMASLKHRKSLLLIVNFFGVDVTGPLLRFPGFWWLV